MKKIYWYLLVLLLSYFAIQPLLGEGFFPMHDDTQVGRVVAMGRSLLNGQFPVRWVEDLGYGYGYPIFNFYGPLPYYIGGFLYALGVSGLAATKFMIGLGIVGAGLTMFWATKRWAGNYGAIVAAVLYIYAPYHAVQVYVRGSIGELWVMVFLPIVFWGIVAASEKNCKTDIWVVGGLGLAGVILSHTIFGYVIVGLCIVWWLVSLRSRDSFVNSGKMLVIALGLSSFFWLPAFTEMNFTAVASQIGGGADYHQHFVCLNQLWYSAWGYGGSAPGCSDGMSFMLGKLVIVLGILGWLTGFLNMKYPSILNSSIFIIGVGSVFALSAWSVGIWERVPFGAYIQYPWRFLSLTVFALAWASAGVGYVMKRRALIGLVIWILIVGAVVLNQAKFFRPQYVITNAAMNYENDQELRFRVSKVSDEYLSPTVLRPDRVEDVVHDTISEVAGLEINQEVDLGHYAKFNIKSDSVKKIVVNRAFFPGFKYFVNGQKAVPEVESGLPNITIPQGDSVVELKLTDTPVRQVGNLISLLSLGYLLWLYGKKTVA